MLDEIIFEEGLKKLGTLFDRRLNDDVKAIYYDELKYISASDFTFSVKKIIRAEKRFPPVSVVQDYINRAISERVEVETEEQKRKEAREVENLKRARTNDSKESERNKARVREIINAIGNVTELKRLGERYRRENLDLEELEFPPSSRCLCDHGLVVVRDGNGYVSIAGCSTCDKGNPNLAQVDPITLDLKRELNHSAWRNKSERGD